MIEDHSSKLKVPNIRTVRFREIEHTNENISI